MCSTSIYSVLDVDGISSLRKNAYSTLANKDHIKNRLYKTKMCTKKNCDMINCNYAHSKSELRVPQCVFGNECLYVHSKNKMCSFIHPFENKKQYCERISEKKNEKKKISI